MGAAGLLFAKATRPRMRGRGSSPHFVHDNSRTPASGYFKLNGVARPAGSTFAVRRRNCGDDLFVNTYDGAASHRYLQILVPGGWFPLNRGKPASTKN